MSLALLGIPGSKFRLRQGLKLWLPVFGDARDWSGQGNHGSVAGASLTADPWGRSNRAYGFDGIDDLIRISEDGSLDITESITVSGWMKGTAQTTTVPISKYDPGATARSWEWSTGAAGQGGIDKMRVLLSKDGSAAEKTYATSVTLLDNTWHHFAFTYIGGNPDGVLKLYADGVEDTSVNKVGDDVVPSLHENDEDVLLGCFDNNNAPGAFFAGQLADLRVYDRALAQREIRLLASLKV